MATVTTMTGAHFDALPYAEGRRWELIAGELIEVSSPTPEHQLIVQKILLALLLYIRMQRGALVLADVEFALGDDIRVRPDVSILCGERAEHLDKTKVPVVGAPHIAVEVISASERTSDSMSKVELYLRHGASEVWQIYPRTRHLVVHSAAQSILKLGEGTAVTTALLPGFELQVSDLFVDEFALGSIIAGLEAPRKTGREE